MPVVTPIATREPMARTRLVAHVLTYAAMLPIAAFLVPAQRGVAGVLATVAVALLLTALVRAIYAAARGGMAEGVAAMLLPRRAIPRGADGYSIVQALEARGEPAAAMARAAELLAASPDDATLCFLVAELHLRHDRAPIAVAILRRLRLDPATAAGDRLRASNRLVDVHLARGAGERAFALRELRTIVREHARSAAAAGAARLLAELEAEGSAGAGEGADAAP